MKETDICKMSDEELIAHLDELQKNAPPPPAAPSKASDLLALAQKMRADAVASARRNPFVTTEEEWLRGAQANATGSLNADRLPEWARAGDDVEPLEYRVDVGPDLDPDGGGDAWRILRDGVTAGFAYQSFAYRLMEWSEEAPEPHDPASYDPIGQGPDDYDIN